MDDTNTSTEVFKLLVQLSLLTVVQKFLSLGILLSLVVVYFIAMIYLETSRQVRLEELASRSAVFSQIVETVRVFPSSHQTVIGQAESLSYMLPSDRRYHHHTRIWMAEPVSIQS